MVRYGILYGFIWELYGISWDIMGFHDGFIGKLRKWWLNMGCFLGFHGDIREYDGRKTGR
jgi:hypothetical protein